MYPPNHARMNNSRPDLRFKGPMLQPLIPEKITPSIEEHVESLGSVPMSWLQKALHSHGLGFSGFTSNLKPLAQNPQP